MTDDRLDALLIGIARIDERTERTEADVRDIKSALYGQGSRGGLLTRMALVERGRRGWWNNRALVAGIVGVLASAATALTAWAAR